jgi:hypothetical protein
MFTSRLRVQGRQVALVFAVMTVAACSSSSGSGPLDATAFGSKFKFADNELSGWTQSTDPTDPYQYGVYTDTTLNQRIDGGNMAYIDRGMRVAMYQDLVGPSGSICTIVAMDFSTDAKADTMFTYQKTQNVASTTLSPYDGTVAIGNSLKTGLTAYAHFKASYFEVQLDGYGADPTAAIPVASQFLQVVEKKTK